MVVLIVAPGRCTGLMSTTFWSQEERYEAEEMAHAEEAYGEYMDDCAMADAPALSFDAWMADCRRQAAQRAATEPAPAFEADEDIPF